MLYESDPEIFVKNYIQEHGIHIEDIGVVPLVLIIWNHETIINLASKIHAEISTHWFYKDLYPLYKGQYQNQSISLVQAPVGAPGTVKMMEEMIACGAKKFIGFGRAFKLQRNIKIGTIIIPTSCVAEDRTSTMYIDNGESAKPNENIVKILKQSALEEKEPLLTGPVWTTDAPKREATSKIENYRHQGILGVDMETSAMYAVGQIRGVGVCNLLVTYDEIEQSSFFVTKEPRVEEALMQAQKIILRSIQLLSQ